MKYITIIRHRWYFKNRITASIYTRYFVGFHQKVLHMEFARYTIIVVIPFTTKEH